MTLLSPCHLELVADLPVPEASQEALGRLGGYCVDKWTVFPPLVAPDAKDRSLEAAGLVWIRKPDRGEYAGRWAVRQTPTGRARYLARL